MRRAERQQWPSAALPRQHRPRGHGQRARILARWLTWVSRVLALVCVLSTVAYIADVQSDYPPNPFYQNYSGLKDWIERSAPLTESPRHTSMAASPSIKTWTRSGTLTHTAQTPTPRRRHRYRAWPYELKEVRCPWMTTDASDAANAESNASTPTPSTLISVFVHGNAGDADQGVYWSCAITLRHALHYAQSGAAHRRIRTFSAALAEQANIHRGGLLRRQADFVADAVEDVVEDVAAEGSSCQVWLVGHSMGGVVAQLAARLFEQTLPALRESKPRDAIRLGGVLTFNTPHRHPPVFMDRAMTEVYAALRAADVRTTAAAMPLPNGSAAHVMDSDAWIAWQLSPRSAARDAVRPARTAHTISLTSGDHDLQIEKTTTALSHTPHAALTMTGGDASDDAARQLWLDGSAYCGGTRSHDGVLLNPCLQALATTALLRPPTPTWSNLVDEAVVRAGQVPRTWYSAWGAFSCQQRLWPAAACTLSLSLQCAALLRLTAVPLSPPNEMTVDVTGSVLLTVIGGRVLGVAVRLAGLGCVSPWSWDAQAFPSLALPLVACGQLALGLLLGQGCAALVAGLITVCRWCVCCRTRRRSRRWLVWLTVSVIGYGVVALTDACHLAVRIVALLVMCAFCTACLLADPATSVMAADAPAPMPSSPLSPTHRSTSRTTSVQVEATEVGVAVLPASQRGAGDKMPRLVLANAALALSFYSAVLLIHSQPFFVYRNMIVSHTADTHDVVDPLFRCVEACLLLSLGLIVAVEASVERGTVLTERLHSMRKLLAGASTTQRRIATRMTQPLAWFGSVMCAAAALDAWRSPVSFLFIVPELARAVLSVWLSAHTTITNPANFL